MVATPIAICFRMEPTGLMYWAYSAYGARTCCTCTTPGHGPTPDSSNIIAIQNLVHELSNSSNIKWLLAKKAQLKKKKTVGMYDES